MNRVFYGHELAAKGAAHDSDGRPVRASGIGGEGMAQCECGKMSPVLPTGAARVRWHKQHSAEVVKKWAIMRQLRRNYEKRIGMTP